MRYPDHIFKETITKYTSPTLDKYGKREDNTGVAIAARVYEKSSLFRDSDDGKDIKYDFVAHVSRTNTDLNIDQRIDVGDARTEIKAMNKPKDMNGEVRFIKIILKRIKV